MVKTRVYRVDREEPDPRLIREAARVLREGGLVAFPTETVYGLGADAFNPQAVKRVFAVKGRPPDNPLIIHIASIEELYRIGVDLDWRAERLARRFWPGPLTLVVKRSASLPDVTVAGLETAAVRMPRHKVALRLIEEAETPIAAPSANKSGRPSPTRVEHVLADLSGEIEIILDGGPTEIGVESTVLDISSERAVILRPGGVSREELEEVIGEVEIHPSALGLVPHGETRPRSPGMKYRHYAPEAKLIVVEGELNVARLAVQGLIDLFKARGMRVGVLGTDGYGYSADVLRDLGPRSRPDEAARRLFDYLREMDDEDVDVVVAEGWSDERGLSLAIMNRLRKASGGTVLDAESLLRMLRRSPASVYSEVMGT